VYKVIWPWFFTTFARLSLCRIGSRFLFCADNLTWGLVFGESLFDLRVYDGLYSLPRLTRLWWGTERINEGHLICTLPVLGSTDAFLLIICEGSFTDAWPLQDWNGGWHSFCFKVMSKERICSFHSSALPCGVLPLIPNALYSQMTLPNPCGQMDICWATILMARWAGGEGRHYVRWLIDLPLDVWESICGGG